MGRVKRLTPVRFKEILRRQNPPVFGQHYEPSIKATREEAPSDSRPAFVWSELLQRDISTLSKPERAVLCIVLYCPFLFELREQQMLPYLPAPHPLHGHPRAVGLALPPLRGTLAVAEDLGVLRWHALVDFDDADDYSASPADSDVAEAEPGCWIGDFLLFLFDVLGPYCVNLSVKATRSGFELPQVGVTPKTNIKKAGQREVARHRVEKALYCDAGIPTHQLAADEIDEMVVANLQQFLPWQKRKHPFDEEEVSGILDALLRGMDAGSSALEILDLLSLSEGWRMQDIKTVMYQAIWQRRLRVNLFERFWLDEPMQPEFKDVMEVYGAWFKRTAS